MVTPAVVVSSTCSNVPSYLHAKNGGAGGDDDHSHGNSCIYTQRDEARHLDTSVEVPPMSNPTTGWLPHCLYVVSA